MGDWDDTAMYQAAVGFDFHPVDAETMAGSFAAAGAPLVPEAVLAEGAGTAPVLRYQDPSGAIASFGPGRARIGFDAGSAPVRAGLARPVDGACSVAWLTLGDLAARGGMEPESPEGAFRTMPVLEDDLRHVDTRCTVRQIFDFLESERVERVLGRLRFTVLFRDDLAVRTAAGNAAAGDPWGPGQLPRHPQGAAITGRILESRRQINMHTGLSFHQLRLRLAHGVSVDACAPPPPTEEGYPVGGWVRGAALITGGLRRRGGEPLHFDDLDDVNSMESYGPSVAGFFGEYGIVEADPAECLGIPLLEDLDPVYAISRAAPTARWRVERYRRADGAPCTGLSREGEDGIGLALSFPGARWGAYVNAADGRLHIAADDVMLAPAEYPEALWGVDVDSFAEYAEQARGRLRGHAADHAREAAAAILAGEAPPGHHPEHLPADFAERVREDLGRALAEAPAYHYGMRVPLCLRIGEIRRAPTELTGPGQEWSTADEEARSRLEAVVDLDGRPAVLHFPGSFEGLTPRTMVIGWGTVCSHLPGHPQVVTGLHDRVGHPRPRLRPAGNPLDELDYSSGEILAGAGCSGDGVEAAFATSRSPAMAAMYLRGIGRDLGVEVLIDPDHSYRIQAAEGVVPALPVGFHQVDALRDALAGALIAHPGAEDPELRALVDMAEALYGGMAEALAAARRRLRAARDAEQLSLPFEPAAGGGEAAGEEQEGLDWDEDEEDPDWAGDGEEGPDWAGDGLWSVDECGGGPAPGDPGEPGPR